MPKKTQQQQQRQQRIGIALYQPIPGAIWALRTVCDGKYLY